MKSQNIEFRSAIKIVAKEDANAKEINRLIADVYGDRSAKYSRVAKSQQNLNVG